MSLEVNETRKQMSITTTWKCHFFFTRIDNFTRLRCVYVWGVIRKSRQSGSQKNSKPREKGVHLLKLNTSHLISLFYCCVLFNRALVDRCGKEGRKTRKWIYFNDQLFETLKLSSRVAKQFSFPRCHASLNFIVWESLYDSYTQLSDIEELMQQNICLWSYSDFIVSS